MDRTEIGCLCQQLVVIFLNRPVKGVGISETEVRIRRKLKVSSKSTKSEDETRAEWDSKTL
jgi:hypothetical protein